MFCNFPNIDSKLFVILGRYAVNVGQPFAHVPGSPGGIDGKYNFLTNDLERVGYKNHLVGKLSSHPFCMEYLTSI